MAAYNSQLKETISELQAKKNEIARATPIIDKKINKLQYAISYNRIIMNKLNLLPTKTPVYKAIGNMYVYDEKDNIIEEIKSLIASFNQTIDKFENRKKKLESESTQYVEKAHKLITQIKETNSK